MPFDTMSTLFAIRDRKDIQAPTKSVLVMLVVRANADGQCWPSHKTIGEDVGVSRRTAQRSIVELGRAGLIRVERRLDSHGDSDSCRYTILCGVASQSPGVASESHHPSVTESPPVVSESHQGGVTLTHKDSIKKPKEASHLRVARKRAPTATLFDEQATESETSKGEHAKVIAAYVENFEKARGHKPKIDSRQAKAAKELRKELGADVAVTIIENAFADPWQAANRPLLSEIAAVADKYRTAKPSLGVARVTVQPSNGSAWKVGTDE